MNVRYIVSGIVQRGDEIILGKKAKGQPPYPDVWHLPGGGVADQERAAMLYAAQDFDNEYFHQEVSREVLEETGVTIKNIHNIIPQYRAEVRQGDSLNKNGEPTHYYFLEYLCEYDSGTPIAGDDIAEVKWVKKSDLKDVSTTAPSQEMYRELGWIVE